MIHCPGCSAGLRFDIPTQQMHCDYCGGSYDPYQFDNVKDDAKNAKVYDTYVWVCPSCGGELTTTDETDAVGFCPYCGGASLLFDRVRTQWRPQYVIPFQLTKEQCKEAYLKEARKHPFVSKKYKDPKLIDSFRGIYMPYWSYQARQKGLYSMDAHKPTKRQGDYLITEHFRLSGQIDLELDGCAHDAATAFDDRISEDLAPFDISGHRKFAPGFLSGFYADVGDVEPDRYKDVTVELLEKQTVNKLMGETGVREALVNNHLTLERDKSKVPTQLTSAQRVLYPVWFLSYRDGDKLTYATVNGQTGKVSADFPASPGKLLTLAGVLAAVLFLILSVFPSVKASVAAMLVGGLLFFGNLFLQASFRMLIKQHDTLAESPEAVKFQKGRLGRMFLCGGLAFIGILLMAIEPASNVVPYLYCIGMAGVLVWLIVRFIRFQLAVSRRRPPQFNKKGASADAT